jgi:hypothetical protein
LIQRTAYDRHARAVEEANSHGLSSVLRLERLLEIVKSAPAAGVASSTLTVAGGLDLSNLSLWISQAKVDPSVSPTQIGQWSDALEAHIRRGSASFEYANLFGQLFTEWLASKDLASQQKLPAGDEGEDVDPEDTFEEVGRQELQEQREQFEARVWGDAQPMDTTPFKKYMEDLFASDREATLTLEHMRENIKNYAESFATQRVQTDALKDTIASLLRQDLLNVRTVSMGDIVQALMYSQNEKRAALQEFTRNELILEEVASVLNMQLSRISSWSWPEEGIEVEMRRALNGKFRFFLDYEILLVSPCSRAALLPILTWF